MILGKLFAQEYNTKAINQVKIEVRFYDNKD